MTKQLKILHLNDRDEGGGAANVARNLHLAALKQGHQSILAVGVKKTDLPGVVAFPTVVTTWTRTLRTLQKWITPLEPRVRFLWRLNRLFKQWEIPQRRLEVLRGRENFYAPGSHQLLKRLPFQPDLVHCFNLHGRYFDFRLLPLMSRRAPVLISMVDPWYFSGHCTHPFECERWQTGCGECPHLDTYPAIQVDGTAYNWQLKQRVYAASQIFTVGCCEWVHDNMKRSMLGPLVKGASVIKIGVPTACFKPANKGSIRKKLGIPIDAHVLLFAANTIKNNPWKDFETMRKAIAILGNRILSKPLLFIALGEEAEPISEGLATIRFIPYKTDPSEVAEFFQLSDIYLHAARADTFPVVNLEAMACGTPVIGTAVGGIVEQIKGCRGILTAAGSELNTYTEDEATGLLVPLGGFQSMAEGIEKLLENPSLRTALSRNARAEALKYYDAKRYYNDYMNLYQSICH